MYYHIHKFRCGKCTVEQTGHVICGMEDVFCFIPCIKCGSTGMALLESECTVEIVPQFLMAGRLFWVTAMPGEVGLQELTKKLGLQNDI